MYILLALDLSIGHLSDRIKLRGVGLGRLVPLRCELYSEEEQRDPQGVARGIERQRTGVGTTVDRKRILHRRHVRRTADP